jgi:uncharacterized membrane protein
MEIRPDYLIAILGMALVTYATRAGGFLLMSRVNMSARLIAGLNHLPGAVIVAIVVPDWLKSGVPGAIAGLLVLLVAWRTNNLLLALATGVLAIYLLRLVI